MRRIPKNELTAKLNWLRRCEYCHFAIMRFRDKASALEYNWSGYCQLCQDDLHKEFVEKGIHHDLKKRTVKEGLTRILGSTEKMFSGHYHKHH